MQGGIGSYTQFVVAKVVGVPPLFTHDAPPPQFVQAAYQRILIATAGPGQDLEGEGASNHSSQPDQLAGLGESCANPAVITAWTVGDIPKPSRAAPCDPVSFAA